MLALAAQCMIRVNTVNCFQTASSRVNPAAWAMARVKCGKGNPDLRAGQTCDADRNHVVWACFLKR